MCLFNRQIEFMASLSTTRLPLCFQEEEYDPSILTVGAWPPLTVSPSLSLVSVDLSFSHRTAQNPAAIPFLRYNANPSGLVSHPLRYHLSSTSSALLSSCPPSFKVSAQALSQVLEGRNLAWFFRPVCWLCCGNCLLRGTQLCSALLCSSPDVNTQPRSLHALKKS